MGFASVTIQSPDAHTWSARAAGLPDYAVSKRICLVPICQMVADQSSGVRTKFREAV